MYLIYINEKVEYHFININGDLNWVELSGSNFGLELRSGRLPMVWDSSLRMIRRHVITILIHKGGDGSPRFDSPRSIIWMETWRTFFPRRMLHQVPLANMSVFPQASLEPEHSGHELSRAALLMLLSNKWEPLSSKQFIKYFSFTNCGEFYIFFSHRQNVRIVLTKMKNII